MARNYYSEINLHIVWHTKLSMPLLTPAVEPAAYRSIRHKIVSTPGAFIHEIGGTETYVHIAVTVAPTIVVSDLIGQVKGVSSHEVNQKMGIGRKLLEWQPGYGVVSFGTKDLEWVKNYLRNQREHHARKTVHERLERIQPEEEVAEADQREAP
jgi:putative transposase